MPTAFHEVRFPLDVALGSQGGPERRTDIVVTGSGREERNARWANARRKYDAGYGVKSLSALADVLAFFEERRGRLYGFRFRDRLDFQSCAIGATPAPTDQAIGTGAAGLASFQLVKRYGTTYAPYDRPIVKPVPGTVRVAIAGIERVAGTDFDVDTTTGIVTFRTGLLPPAGASVTAGFQFDVPVRFDTDYLEADLSGFTSGTIPQIPLIELIL